MTDPRSKAGKLKTVRGSGAGTDQINDEQDWHSKMKTTCFPKLNLNDLRCVVSETGDHELEDQPDGSARCLDCDWTCRHTIKITRGSDEFCQGCGYQTRFGDDDDEDDEEDDDDEDDEDDEEDDDDEDD